jgi:hypothetical protein
LAYGTHLMSSGMTTHFHPKLAIAHANRQILITGTAAFAVLLPLLRHFADTIPAAYILLFEAALCLALFLFKGQRRARAVRTWEFATQAELLRVAFPEEPEVTVDPPALILPLAA